MTVRVIEYQPDYEVAPHAIVWRSLKYFTRASREGEDALDKYQGASFVIGNDIHFDLRVYRGHPKCTVTLYLPDDVKDEKLIREIVDKVIREMLIPHSAVAWRRGQPFEIGKPLKRHEDDRLHEGEARILALKIASQEPTGTASTTLLKREVPKYVEFSSRDLQTSSTRPNERLWQQIVGNVVSHWKSAAGPFALGYANRTPGGLTITDKGISYLNSLGFSSASNSEPSG